MSDFTLDELYDIYDAVMETRVAMFAHLPAKIQAMIDNYFVGECKHKWIKCFYGEESIPINLCALCNLRERR